MFSKDQRKSPRSCHPIASFSSDPNLQNAWERCILGCWLHTCYFHLSNIYFFSSSNWSTALSTSQQEEVKQKLIVHTQNRLFRTSGHTDFPKQPGYFLVKALDSEGYSMTFYYIPFVNRLVRVKVLWLEATETN